jgi:mersacidin/lichenicidin family type 2 lantibiotic
MNSVNVIRAWKDDVYRGDLSEGERALLPDHPAGVVELTSGELANVAGGRKRRRRKKSSRSRSRS